MRGPALRQHIVETATNLFYGEGFRATGVDTLAKACGTTKKSLYNHFANKEVLIAEVLRSRHLAWVEAVERTLAGSKDEISGIMNWFDATEKSIRNPNYRGCIFFNASIEYPDAGPEIWAVIQENNDYSHRRLLELLKGAGFSPKVSQSLAHQIGVLRRGAQMTAMSTGDPSAVSYAKAAAKTALDTAKRKSKK